MKNKLAFLGSLISFAAVCFLLIIFTFYIDGEMGIILVFFSFSAPIVSLIFTFIGRDKVNVSIDCEAYVKKGSNAIVSINVEKTGKLPISFIEIHTEAGEVFSQSINTYKTAVNFNKSIKIEHTLTAVHAGYSEFKIKAVYLCDFLGFVRIKSKNQLPATHTISSIPELPLISASTRLFRMISDLVITSDDEEEQDSSIAFSANTSPGYEHREYVDGDSMKRINWKASSKRDKLLVRLDEAVSCVQPAIIFDLYRSSDSTVIDSIIDEEKLYEAVFGMLSLFVKQGIGCKFYYRNSFGVIEERLVDSEDSVNMLLFSVLSVPIKSNSPIALDKINSEGACAMMISVPYVDETYSSLIDKISNKENCSVIVSDEEKCKANSACQMWHLDNDNNFRLISYGKSQE